MIVGIKCGLGRVEDDKNMGECFDALKTNGKMILKVIF